MIPLDQWLRERLRAAPESLRDRVLVEAEAEMSGRGTTGDGAAILAQAGRRLLEEAKSGPDDRQTAMTLLAADALITFACEAAAGERPEALGSL